MGFITSTFIATSDHSGAGIELPTTALLDSIDAVAEATITEIDRRLAGMTPAELAQYDARLDAELEAWLAEDED